MSTEAIADTVRRLYEARLTNDPERCVELFAEDATLSFAGSQIGGSSSPAASGRNALRALLTALTATWKWSAFDLEAALIDGRQAATRYRVTGTHVPSGRSFATEVMDHIVRDDDGRIRSVVQFVDTALVERLNGGPLA